MVDEIRLIFGRPAIKDRMELISALRAISASHGCIIQALDADKIVGVRHLLFASKKAVQAFDEKRNIAKDLSVEFLRYASGERQIERALSIGLSSSTKRIVLVLFPASSNASCRLPDASELAFAVEEDGLGCSFNAKMVKEAFNISEEEIRAVGESRIPDLVLERVALVDTYR
jgi:KEOPS complex subunit Cgi121